MKKLLFLLLFIPVICSAQTRGHIDVTASLDTTVFIPKRSVALLEIDIGGVANTDSLWVGYSNDVGGFVAADGFPVVCDKSTYKQYVNGVWSYRIGVITTGTWPGIYAVIRYKAVDGTTGNQLPWSYAR